MTVWASEVVGLGDLVIVVNHDTGDLTFGEVRAVTQDFAICRGVVNGRPADARIPVQLLSAEARSGEADDGEGRPGGTAPG